MKIQKEQLKYGLFALPFVTLVASSGFHFSPQYLENPSSQGFFPVVTTLSTLLSIFSILLILHIFTLHKKMADQQREGGIYENIRLKDLQRKVELLSALREMSLAINEQTDFKSILFTVLHLVDVVLSPQKICIFLKREESLEGVAFRQGKKTLFFEEVPPLSQHQIWASECFNRKRNMKYPSGEGQVFAHLLSAEKEPLGVMILELDSREDLPEEKSLEVLSKHIALAIRKPTLYDRAVIDSLTTLYTKGHFVQQFQKLFSMSRRLGKSFSLIFIDIDHFKFVNDTYGHLTGDIVLHQVGQVLKNSIREYDSAYRYGGEELALLLPEAEEKDAIAIADRIRRKIEELEITGEKGETLKITLSAGVVSYTPQYNSIEDMISQADQFLYQAKRSGRNRVVPSPVLAKKVG